MVNPNALYDEIKKALDDYNDGNYKDDNEKPEHLKKMGDAMKKYFEKEIEVTYGWLAMMVAGTSTVPDPKVTFDSTAKFPTYDLTSSKCLNAPADKNFSMPSMAMAIMQAHSGAMVKHPPDFTLPPGNFLAVSPPSLMETATKDTLDKAIKMNICMPVCMWYMTTLNPAPLSGMHMQYNLGAMTLVMIVK
jgi:hypothetical protein